MANVPLTDSFGLGKAFRDVWHSLTSYDRHADFDSPYRTGSHVPLAQSRHAPLTSVATTASESRADVSSGYFEDGGRGSLGGSTADGFSHPPMSPGGRSPYSPGMRSTATMAQSGGNEVETTGEIQMQAFQEGLPPPPPCGHSWKKIDRWCEEHYPELWDQLCEGCTNNDLNALEHQLDCSLPMEVRESLQIHDGQEHGGRPTGIVFSSMLLDCEEIVHEWTNWKTVNESYLTQPVSYNPSALPKAFGGGSSAASSSKPTNPAQNQNWRTDLSSRQDSQPPGAIQCVYAHPSWIPLARDWGGNNLAVDLAPGPTGKWGQVILFGRDYDCKYVIARSWSAFLATLADDMNSGKWWIDEDTQELKLREFKTQNVEPAYFDILRWRCDQKYGRKNPNRRRTMQPQNGSAQNGRGSPSPTGASPYASPTAEVGELRGRSMQRFSGASPVVSPNRPNYSKSSPLARVTEEGNSPIKVHTNGLNISNKLVDAATPTTPHVVEDAKKTRLMDSLLTPVASDDDKENKTNGESNATKTAAMTKTSQVEDDTMKTIEI